MAIYKAPHAGTKIYRTRVPFNDTHRQFDLTYGEVFPVMAKFCLPGDVWKIGANALIRYKKMLSPTLTKSDAFFRFFFVPLRQVVDNIEEIVTGSKNGSLIESALPECEDFISHIISKYNSGDMPNTSKSSFGKCIVRKNSFWSALGFPFARKNQAYYDASQYSGDFRVRLMVQSVDEFAGMDDIPAEYWYKAYCKIIWEYFRDENYQSFDGDFDKFYDYMCCSKGAAEVTGNDVFDNAWYLSNLQYRKVQKDFSCDGINYNFNTNSYDNVSPDDGVDYYKLWFTDLRKDYFTSSLPWIMKGVQPTINSVMHVDFSNAFSSVTTDSGVPIGVNTVNKTLVSGLARADGYVDNNLSYAAGIEAMNKATVVNDGFTAQDVRDMFAETRVFERLARCGSRYVEYLEANFGIAPRDDTLQRPLYLGGFRQPIVTTEVVQTGGNSDDVGTLRGHGISSYGNRIKPFVATEFGLIFGLMYVTPKTQYLFQSKKELTYKKRFDFFNPSFQLLSEQQVRSSEKFMPVAKWEGVSENMQWVFKKSKVNFFTYGYQGMYNELRYDNDLVLRSLVDSEEYWTQSINPMVEEFGNIGTAPNYTKISLGYKNGDSTKPLNGVNICIASYLENLLKPFESQDSSFKPMIVDFVNNTTVFRPMVKDPIPSLTDHN